MTLQQKKLFQFFLIRAQHQNLTKDLPACSPPIRWYFHEVYTFIHISLIMFYYAMKSRFGWQAWDCVLGQILMREKGESSYEISIFHQFLFWSEMGLSVVCKSELSESFWLSHTREHII